MRECSRSPRGRPRTSRSCRRVADKLLHADRSEYDGLPPAYPPRPHPNGPARYGPALPSFPPVPLSRLRRRPAWPTGPHRTSAYSARAPSAPAASPRSPRPPPQPRLRRRLRCLTSGVRSCTRSESQARFSGPPPRSSPPAAENSACARRVARVSVDSPCYSPTFFLPHVCCDLHSHSTRVQVPLDGIHRPYPEPPGADLHAGNWKEAPRPEPLPRARSVPKEKKDGLHAANKGRWEEMAAVGGGGRVCSRCCCGRASFASAACPAFASSALTE